MVCCFIQIALQDLKKHNLNDVGNDISVIQHNILFRKNNVRLFG